jgi:hypothetical protein
MHGCVNHKEDIVLTREDYHRYNQRRAALAGVKLVKGVELVCIIHVFFSIVLSEFVLSNFLPVYFCVCVCLRVFVFVSLLFQPHSQAS